MSQEPQVMGRVLRAATTSFSVGCRELLAAEGLRVPRFGGLVRAPGRDGETLYGLVYSVRIEDDMFVRQLVAAGADSPEIVEDQRQKRQVPVEVDVAVVGYGVGDAVYHRLPPQPPRTLDTIEMSGDEELVRFTARHDWMRVVLASPDAPADQLLVATLLAAADARAPGERTLCVGRARPPRDSADARAPGDRNDYLVGAGRELARLLALDPTRLDGILRQLT